MAISSTRRQRIIEFSTPKVADLVVVEIKDASKNLKSADSADHVADNDGNFGAAHPDTNNFPDFKLALIKNADDDQGQFQLWYYVKDRADQDHYNWEFQAAGVGSSRYDSVVRTYLLARKDYNEANPAINEAMPVTDSDPFESTDNYVLFEKKQVRSGDETLDSLYVVEQRTFVKKVPIRRVDLDETFDEPLRSKETIFYKGEIPQKTFVFGEADVTKPETNSKTTAQTFALGAEATSTYDVPNPDLVAPFFGTSIVTNGNNKFGVLCEGRQISDNWYAVSERELIKTDANNIVDTYITYQNFSWPPVLDRIVVDRWTRRDGGADPVEYPIYKRGAYTGPTRVEVKIYWKDSEWTIGTTADGSDTELALIKPMHPEPILFQSPIASVSVPPSLHDRFIVTASTGTGHPVYTYKGTTWIYNATNYVDWPDSLVVQDSQRPFRGGFLREKITAFIPKVGT
jgi:hypothetical protein